MENSQFTIIGHRGDAGSAPENTLAAIDRGLKMGTDILEIDVHLTRDGHLCVMHDKKVDRTTNGRGKIKDLTWDQIQKLDAGGWYSDSFKNEKVPSLEQVIEKINGKSQLLIEIKKGTPYYPQIEEKVLETIHRLKAEKWCIIQSFNMKLLQHIHRLDPEIRLQKLEIFVIPELHISFDGTLRHFDPVKNNFFESYNINYFFLTSSIIKHIHNSNKSVYVWTANSESVIKRMINMGADGIITNHPRIAKKLRTDTSAL